MKDTKRHAAFKRALTLMRYTPVLICIIMFVHVLLLTFGMRLYIAENMLVMLFAAALFATDYAYGFCWLHRAFIIYGVAVDWCINIERTIGFGKLLDAMHLLMAVAGGVLITLLIVNITGHGKCNRGQGKAQ